MPTNVRNLRMPAAVLTAAAGVSLLSGFGAAAHAATPVQPTAHQKHVAHLTHLKHVQAHVHHLRHVAHLNEKKAAASAHAHHLRHVAHVNEIAKAVASKAGHARHLRHVAHVNQATKAFAASEARHAHHLNHLRHENVHTAAKAVNAAVTTVATGASGSPQQIAAALVPAGQLASFDQIISHESGWNVHATNASSGAYGLGQALPGSKMASEGGDWQNSATTQIKWALNYMDSRYGSPNAAWSFWQAHNWY